MAKNDSWNTKGTALLIVLVLAASLRLSFLGSKSLWLDESLSVSFAHLPLERLWQPNDIRPETHPPLYYHGLHYWIDWFGDSETAVRLPSALISLVNVALIYVLGRRLFSHRVGVLAAALLALSPLNLWYAQEARMYVFMTTIMLLAAILLTWDSWWTIPPLTATFAAGLYIDYTMLPIWAVLSAIWIVSWWQHGRARRPFLIWFSASLIAWLLFLPWLANFYAAIETFSTVHIFIRLNETFDLPFLTPGQYLLVMLSGTMIMIPLLALLLTLQRRERSKHWLSIAVLVGFALATLLFSLPRLYGIKRILVQIWPLIILWVAWIVNQLGYQQRRVAWSLLALSLAMSLITLLAVPKDDWRGAVEHVNSSASLNDVAWIDPFFNRAPVSYYDLNLPIETERSGYLPEYNSGELWLFAQRLPGQSLPSSLTEQQLDDNMELIEAIPFYRLEIRRYHPKEQ